MTFADSLIQTLGGLTGDGNFQMVGTILKRTPNEDEYGNKLDERHETIDIMGFFTEGWRGRKTIEPQGVEPEVAMTMFYTNDISTPISLADKFLYNNAYYNITNVTLYRAGVQLFQRRLTLSTAKIEEVGPDGIV